MGKLNTAKPVKKKSRRNSGHHEIVSDELPHSSNDNNAEVNRHSRSRSHSQDSLARQPLLRANKQSNSRKNSTENTPSKRGKLMKQRKIQGVQNNNAIPVTMPEIVVDPITGVRTFTKSKDTAKAGPIVTDTAQVHSNEELEEGQVSDIDQTDNSLYHQDNDGADEAQDPDGIDLSVRASKEDFMSSDEDEEQISDKEDASQDDEVTINKNRHRDVQNMSKEELKRNPAFLELMDEMLESKLKEHEGKSTPNRLTLSNEKRGDFPLKSSSDTTLYTPALKKNDHSKAPPILNRLDNNNIVQNNVSNQITDFVESVRRCASEPETTPGTSREVTTTGRARQLILDAEQFKADVAGPQGKNMVDINEVYDLIKSIKMSVDQDNDDDFFHITCHIDPVVKKKIEQGQFVELDKLFT